MKLYTAINSAFLFISLAFYNAIAYASSAATKNEVAKRLLMGNAGTKPTPAPNFDGLANSLSGLAQLIKTLAILGGVALMLFSIQMYIRHRKNPMETPLSMVITVFFIGLILIAVSFTSIKF